MSPTPTNIADLALAAADAAAEAAALRQQAKDITERSKAVEAIAKKAAEFAIDIDPEDVRREGMNHLCDVKVDDDLMLRFNVDVNWDTDHWRGIRSAVPAGVAWAKGIPSEQLDWDLKPGVEKKGMGGGTYGCYHLDTQYGDLAFVKDLAGLGRCVKLTREARKQWRKKHLGLGAVLVEKS